MALEELSQRGRVAAALHDDPTPVGFKALLHGVGLGIGAWESGALWVAHKDERVDLLVVGRCCGGASGRSRLRNWMHAGARLCARALCASGARLCALALCAWWVRAIAGPTVEGMPVEEVQQPQHPCRFPVAPRLYKAVVVHSLIDYRLIPTPIPWPAVPPLVENAPASLALRCDAVELLILVPEARTCAGVTHIDLRDQTGRLVAGLFHVVSPQTREVSVHNGVERAGPCALRHLEPVRAFDALLAVGKSHAPLTHATFEGEASRWLNLGGVGLELHLESLPVCFSEAAKGRRVLVVRVLCNGVLLQLVRDPVVEGGFRVDLGHADDGVRGPTVRVREFPKARAGGKNADAAPFPLRRVQVYIGTSGVQAMTENSYDCDI